MAPMDASFKLIAMGAVRSDLQPPAATAAAFWCRGPLPFSSSLPGLASPTTARACRTRLRCVLLVLMLTWLRSTPATLCSASFPPSSVQSTTRRSAASLWRCVRLPPAPHSSVARSCLQEVLSTGLPSLGAHPSLNGGRCVAVAGLARGGRAVYAGAWGRRALWDPQEQLDHFAGRRVCQWRAVAAHYRACGSGPLGRCDCCCVCG